MGRFKGKIWGRRSAAYVGGMTLEFKTCDGITDALVERAKQGIFGYGVVPDEYYELF